MNADNVCMCAYMYIYIYIYMYYGPFCAGRLRWPRPSGPTPRWSDETSDYPASLVRGILSQPSLSQPSKFLIWMMLSSRPSRRGRRDRTRLRTSSSPGSLRRGFEHSCGCKCSIRVCIISIISIIIGVLLAFASLALVSAGFVKREVCVILSSRMDRKQ